MARKPGINCNTCGSETKVAYIRDPRRSRNGYVPVSHFCLTCGHHEGSASPIDLRPQAIKDSTQFPMKGGRFLTHHEAYLIDDLLVELDRWIATERTHGARRAFSRLAGVMLEVFPPTRGFWRIEAQSGTEVQTSMLEQDNIVGHHQ